MMAIELAKHVNPAKVILISSAATCYEIPWYFRLAGRLRLHRVLPHAFFKQTNLVTFYIFGVHTPDDQQLLSTILKTTDINFLLWAIHRIVTWNNTIVPSTIWRIHGSRDRLLPLHTADVVIREGGHLIALNEAQAVREGIDRALN